MKESLFKMKPVFSVENFQFQINSLQDKDLIYRGLANIEWCVEASIFRRIEKYSLYKYQKFPTFFAFPMKIAFLKWPFP